jgi:hypothetical protein
VVKELGPVARESDDVDARFGEQAGVGCAMPGVYAVIAEVDAAVVDRVADAMEVSAADPQQREMVRGYFDAATFDDLPAPARPPTRPRPPPGHCPATAAAVTCSLWSRWPGRPPAA